MCRTKNKKIKVPNKDSLSVHKRISNIMHRTSVSFFGEQVM